MSIPDYVLEYDIPGDDQMASFMNATLQSTHDRNTDFSIATYVSIPPDISYQGMAAVAEYLDEVLGNLAGDGVRFSVQVGKGSAA